MSPRALSRTLAATALATGLAIVPVAVLAQDFNNQLRARQGLMRVQALNLGVLSGMARGQMDYDAEAAQAAANNLDAVSHIDQRFNWPEGSSTMDIENTRALPEIWDDYDAFLAEWAKFGEATEALVAVAGTGAAEMGAALQAVGASCGSCHESFQQPR